MKSRTFGFLLSAALMANAVFAAQVSLSWQDNSDNEDGFRLERATGAGAFITLASVGADVEEFADVLVEPGVTYRYRCFSFNTGGESAPSNTATVTVPAVEPAPAGPTLLELTSPGRLVNISTRGLNLVGAEILIAGFVVEGGPVTVLLRAVGPSLAQFNVPNVLANPRIALIGGPSNDDWSGADVAAAAARVNAFALPAGSRDAALLVTLAPGQYTAHVTGVAGATGVCLVEVYEVPAP